MTINLPNVYGLMIHDLDYGLNHPSWSTDLDYILNPWIQRRIENREIIIGRNHFNNTDNFYSNKYHILSKRLQQNIFNKRIKIHDSIDSLTTYIKKNQHKEFIVLGGSRTFDSTIDLISDVFVARINGKYSCSNNLSGRIIKLLNSRFSIRSSTIGGNNNLVTFFHYWETRY